MPFEQGVPMIPGRSRKTYVMLDRAIHFDTTVGCKGYDKIGEEVKHSEACHERFRVFLEEKFRKAVEDAEAKKLSAEVRERLEAQEEAGVFELEERTREIEAEATETEVPDVPAGTVRPIPKKSHENSEEPSNDFWEFDKGKGACGKIHIKSRKRLLQLAMIVHLVQMMFHQKGSLSGNAGEKIHIISMIGSPTHINEFHQKAG
jgi:hypothetical protein